MQHPTVQQWVQLQRHKHCVGRQRAVSAAGAPATVDRDRLATATAAVPVAPATAAAPAAADPCLDLTGVKAASVGALVGSMCGNALGVQVEPEKVWSVAMLSPWGPWVWQSVVTELQLWHANVCCHQSDCAWWYVGNIQAKGH